MSDKRKTRYFIRVAATLLIALLSVSSLSACSSSQAGNDYDPTKI
ncbi:hypothetical protein [Candidatus Methylospira mobilis]|nr:hypothetical protein [Candidatus Methylospira mobilis]